MAPSALYTKLYSLAQAHAQPKDLAHILSIRAPDAIHAWGPAYLVSRNPGLQDRMDNEAFETHVQSTGRYLNVQRTEVHEIVVDEHQRRATVHMSYMLAAKNSYELVEHDLMWALKFTEGEEVDAVLIAESVEYVDGAACARVGTLARKLHGELGADVRGGLTVTKLD